MEFINPPSAPAVVGPYSVTCRLDNGFLFLSGQISLDPVSGQLLGSTPAEQTNIIMTNIIRILSDCGYSLDHIFKCVIYTTQLSEFASINSAYEKALGNHKPVRSTVGVTALPKGGLVEIEVTAFRG